MLKTFTAFYSLLPLRTVFSARFYKKCSGFCLIINFLKPVILRATENKLLLVRFFSTSWNNIAGLLQPCIFPSSKWCMHILLSISPLFSLSLSHWQELWFWLWMVSACCLWLCSVCLRSLVLASEHPKSLLHSFCHSLPPSCLFTLCSPSTQSFQPHLHRPWDCLPSVVNVKRD